MACHSSLSLAPCLGLLSSESALHCNFKLALALSLSRSRYSRTSAATLTYLARWWRWRRSRRLNLRRPQQSTWSLPSRPRGLQHRRQGARRRARADGGGAAGGLQRSPCSTKSRKRLQKPQRRFRRMWGSVIAQFLMITCFFGEVDVFCFFYGFGFGLGFGCGRGRDEVRESVLVCVVVKTQIWMWGSAIPQLLMISCLFWWSWSALLFFFGGFLWLWPGLGRDAGLCIGKCCGCHANFWGFDRFEDLIGRSCDPGTIGFTRWLTKLWRVATFWISEVFTEFL